MKKSLKILLLFVFAFIIFSIGQNVKANTIKKLSMEIYVDNNGDAYVTETWECNDYEKTEHYHTFNDLGNSVISDLSVSLNGTDFTYLSHWNTSGTLSSKAYKCGFNKTSTGTEVCWGISSYGKNNVYVAKYKISNFVENTEDAQMIYWNLIDFSQSINSAYIKIYSDFKYDNNTPVWGFGNYGGTCYVYDGYIEMAPNGSLGSSEYMVILAKFPSGTFNTTNNAGNTFDYYLEMANQGATPYSKGSSSSSNLFSSVTNPIGKFILASFGLLFMAFLSPATWVIIILIIVAANTKRIRYDYEEGMAMPKDVEYYRDIPCNGDIFRAYYIAYRYKLVKKKTDLLGAVILKWLKESIIKIDQREVGMIFKKEDTVVILNETDPTQIQNPFEKRLFNMLYEASKDGILEDKEFEKWCNRGYSRLLGWFEEIIKDQENKLITEGAITVEDVKKSGFGKATVYKLSSSLKREAEQINGLKQYLLEYTLISDRKPLEVHLFEDYLIFAQILGIAKQVAKDFKDLYPEIVAESHFTSYDHIMFIHTCATHGVSAASSAQSRASSYSGGGGGFSSGGGGGGSHGGGGGGSR